ncbi:hypothetical protein VPH35_088862 [Triticum aestivum]
MGAGGIPCRLRLLLLLAVVLLLLLSTASCADLYAVVYKGCANQTFAGGAPPPTVAALSSALAAQSASASVFGLFQCRGDLSGPDCSSCVARAMSSWRDLCGGAVAARVQLNGCLALYEISGFPQVPGVQMLFKTCGSGGGAAGAPDFETRRGTAFSPLLRARRAVGLRLRLRPLPVPRRPLRPGLLLLRRARHVLLARPLRRRRRGPRPAQRLPLALQDLRLPPGPRRSDALQDLRLWRGRRRRPGLRDPPRHRLQPARGRSGLQRAGGGGGGGGFFATSFQQVYALAQCEGDLSNVDCSNCVTQAVQRVAVECGGAPSGQVYLDKCYITYSYYPHGVPHGGGGGLGGILPFLLPRRHGHAETLHTIVIVLTSWICSTPMLMWIWCSWSERRESWALLTGG